VAGAHKVRPYDGELVKLQSAVIDRRYRRIELPRRRAGAQKKPPPEKPAAVG
jgi:hypothetical protein